MLLSDIAIELGGGVTAGGGEEDGGSKGEEERQATARRACVDIFASGGNGGAAPVKSIGHRDSVGLRVLVNDNKSIVAGAQHAVAVNTVLERGRAQRACADGCTAWSQPLIRRRSLPFRIFCFLHGLKIAAGKINVHAKDVTAAGYGHSGTRHVRGVVLDQQRGGCPGSGFTIGDRDSADTKGCAAAGSLNMTSSSGAAAPLQRQRRRACRAVQRQPRCGPPSILRK